MIEQSFLNDVEIQIAIALGRGLSKFAIFPYGEAGEYVQRLLDTKGIKDYVILDNHKCKDCKNIYPASWLRGRDIYVLFAVYRYELRDLLKREVLKYVNENRIIFLGQYELDYAYFEKDYIHLKAKERGIDENERIYHFSSHDLKMWLPHYDVDVLQKTILEKDAYFEEGLLYYTTKIFRNGIIKKKMKQGMTLDIGANIGNHTLYYALECGAKEVISFEPIKEIFSILKKNITINKIEERVKLYNVGIGESHSRARNSLFVPSNMGGSKIEVCDEGDLEIISIDELKLDQVQFMKVDVETFEIHVVKGAMETIKKCRPYIMMEVWDDTRHIFEILHLLMPLGYQVQRISSCDYLFSPEELCL